MKRLFSALLILFFIHLLYASTPSLNKLDANLKRQIRLYQENPSLQKTSDHPVSVIIKGIHVQSVVQDNGGETGTVIPNYVTARVPVSSLLTMIENPAVHSIQMSKRVYLKNDLSGEDTGASKANAGESPLSNSYTGKDVIIGIIDTGIDVEHEDFQNSDGTTRILYLWDQNATPAASPPETEGFSYGHEWTQQQINNGYCTHEDLDGHGTHVAGTAAGNGRAVNKYSGMAPEADLIIVATDQSSGGIADAASYIFQKADALGKPCVINASLGWHSGFHDGTDGVCEILDVLSNKSGRLFCASSGNEGNDRIHLTPPVASDPVWSYYFANQDGYLQFYIRIPNNYLSVTSFAVGVDESDFNPEDESGGPLQYLGKTNYYTAESIQSNDGVYKNLKFNGSIVGRVSFETEVVSDSVIGLVIFIEEEDLNWNTETGEVSDLDLWRLYIQNGNPHIDVWVADLGYSFPDVPNAIDYLTPDNQSSVGLPAVAKNVIAVGGSINRTEYISQAGDTYYSEGTTGNLASFSSLGPTADGRIKPEIVAPGDNVISSMSQSAFDEGYFYSEEVVQGGKHVISSGTSMSSPAVAGCLGLFLQMHPEANYQDVKDAFQSSARQDAFTGSQLPDNSWGYGKMDIFEMLKKETGVPNIQSFQKNIILISNYPNPFNPDTEIRYQISEASPVQLTVYDVMGREIVVLMNEVQQPGSYKIRYNPLDYGDASNATGVYICRVQTNEMSDIRKMLYLK